MSKIKSKIIWSFILFGGIQGAFAAQTLRETAAGPDTAETVVNVDAAIITGEGAALPGVNLGVATRISNEAPLYLGGEFGAYISTGYSSYALFPFLASMYYQFEPHAVVHPLVGMMAGPVLATGGGVSTARFALMFRPGVNIELGKRAVLNLEPRFGVLGSDFVFAPQMGAVFAL